MKDVHTTPAEAVEAHQILGAQVSVAIHFGTFRLARDGQDQPVQDLNQALAKTNLGDSEFWVLDFGEGRAVRVPPVPWAD
jgi:L-ascorbate metabolism protein UlaG (beta-lactamase superfamily)